MAKSDKLLKRAGDWEKAASKLDTVAAKLRTKAAEANVQAEELKSKEKKGGFGKVLLVLLVLGGAGFAASRLRSKAS